MEPISLDQFIERGFTGFVHSDEIYPLVRDIFTKYPIERLDSIGNSDTAALRRLQNDLPKDKLVRRLYGIWGKEFAAGEQQLNDITRVILIHKLPSARIIRQDRMEDYSAIDRQEVWLMVDDDKGIPQRIAMGLFPKNTSLDNLVFTPEEIFYAEKAQWELQAGKPPRLIVPPNTYILKASNTVVFREKITEKEKRALVHGVIESITNPLLGTSRKTQNYERIANKVVRSLLAFFPSVINENGGINYDAVHNIFQKVRRRNIQIGSYVTDSSYPNMGRYLEKAVHEHMPLPIAVVSTRVKNPRRIAEKLIQVLYNLQSEDEQKKEVGKQFEDYLGIRGIVSDRNEIYRLFKLLKANFEISQVKDYIKNPKQFRNPRTGKPMVDPTTGKPLQYRTLQFTLRRDGIPYACQLRDHEMDREAEHDPRFAHDGGFIQRKREMIAKVPKAVQIAVHTLMGTYRDEQKVFYKPQ